MLKVLIKALDPSQEYETGLRLELIKLLPQESVTEFLRAMKERESDPFHELREQFKADPATVAVTGLQSRLTDAKLRLSQDQESVKQAEEALDVAIAAGLGESDAEAGLKQAVSDRDLSSRRVSTLTKELDAAVSKRKLRWQHLSEQLRLDLLRDAEAKLEAENNRFDAFFAEHALPFARMKYRVNQMRSKETVPNCP